MKNFNFKSAFKKIVILLVIIIFVLPLLVRANPFISVEYGTVGVISRFGKIQRLVNPGLNFKIPFAEKVTFYSTQKIIYETSEAPQTSPYYNESKTKTVTNSNDQKYVSDLADYAVDTSTKDGQQVSIRFTLRYSLDPSKILWIAESIGTQEQVATRIVQAQSRSITRNVAREFPANELYTGNVFNYQARVADLLKETFEENGVILDEFLVRQMKFSDQYIL